LKRKFSEEQQMQSTSFVALTGHLNDYPLADLISMLRFRRKTGRLLIEYAIGPCSLYFVEGNLVDAQLNSMGGLQAVLVALSQPNASFNFNPLIQPPRRSINEASQKVVLELLGCWEEKTVNVDGPERQGRAVSSPPAEPITVTPIEAERLPEAKEVLALPPSSLELASRRRQRQVLIASAVISLLVSLITVAALTRWLIRRDIAAALSELNKRGDAGGGERGGGMGAQVVKVAVRVEQGRVTQASVEEHRPGMEAYEALALRIARSRRYDQAASGQDLVLVKINAPD
jgi:DNA-binding transcriptional regulator of glucitol operon